MQISIIVAVAKNGVIGNNNQLPWHLPEDLQRFKQLTTGHHILMGSSTFDSIGKTLPNRTNMILSSNTIENKGVVNINSLWDGIDQAEKAGETELFIIGGEHIYKQALAYATKIYLTQIHKEFEGDRYFKFNATEWEIKKSETHKNSDFEYSYQIYERSLIGQPLACGIGSNFC
jgi:dihydrofolate reductase